MSMSRQNPGDDQLKRLAAQLSSERARAARLQASLIVEQQKFRQMQEAYNRRDSEAWNLSHTLETLKVEMRNLSTRSAAMYGELLAARSGGSAALPAAKIERRDEPRPAEPVGALSPEDQESAAALQAMIMDLQDRYQQALSLVFDEWNTRTAAEARVRELEEQVAAFVANLQARRPGVTIEG